MCSWLPVIPVVLNAPVGVRTSDHPEWVLPVGWTPTHDLPPLEAILTTPNGLEIRPYTRGFGAMMEGAGDDPADRPHIGVALMHPRSRGRLRIVSDDPEVAPIIEHRYDSDPHDVAMLSAGAELARELASSSTEVGHAAGRRPSICVQPRRWDPKATRRRSSTSDAGCAASTDYGWSTARCFPPSPAAAPTPRS